MPKDPPIINTGRPKVGPADPATRKRMLNERLAEREPLQRVDRPVKKPRNVVMDKPATKDLSVFSAARKIRERPLKINKVADE